MTATEGWRTGHRRGGCEGCGAAFTPGSTVVSALYEAAALPKSSEPAEAPESTQPEASATSADAADDDAPAFGRRDWCVVCFDGEADTGGPFSWWRAPVPEPEVTRAVFDLDVAREFFLRLVEDETEDRAPLRYLLALLLMRKRIVKVDEQFEDERGEIMVVRVPPSESRWEITCPELDENETDDLRDELGRLFDLGDEEEA